MPLFIQCYIRSSVIYGYTTTHTYDAYVCIWIVHIRNSVSSPGEDKYQKITNVSIIVLGVYTCGIAVLLWALYKGFCSSREKYTCNLEGMYVTYMYVVYS